MKLCLAVSLAGAALAGGSAAALATSSDARGGHAVVPAAPLTTKAPYQPKLVRSHVERAEPLHGGHATSS